MKHEAHVWRWRQYRFRTSRLEQFYFWSWRVLVLSLVMFFAGMSVADFEWYERADRLVAACVQAHQSLAR